MTTPVDLGSSLSSMGDATNAQTLAALKVKGKAKAASHEFEAMFINSMFQEMLTGVDGDGPLGGSGALKVWRSFMVNQYAQLFAKNGGLGIASHVYDELLKQQGMSAS
jgi:Rod binding domain-containing protein